MRYDKPSDCVNRVIDELRELGMTDADIGHKLMLLGTQMLINGRCCKKHLIESLEGMGSTLTRLKKEAEALPNEVLH